ncbi:MAG: hypothetical protein R2851_25565 [Caldilineaceae bacterium]
MDTGRIISGTALIFAEGGAAGCLPHGRRARTASSSARMTAWPPIPPGYALATFDADGDGD